MAGFRFIVPVVFAFVTVAQCHMKWPPKNKVLHIGGIFPINGTEGWQGGMVWTVSSFLLLYINNCSLFFQACQPSAMMALDDVNSRSDLLPGYKLKLHWNDSEVSSSLGL